MTRNRLVLVLAGMFMVTLASACAGTNPSSTAGPGTNPETSMTTSPSGSSGASASPGNSAGKPSEPGDAAVWILEPDQKPQGSSTKFVAMVARLGCNGGVTGRVLAPQIRMSESEVIVTFSVAPKQLGAATCPGNKPVPYEVELGEPLQHRRLVDGQCLPGGEAATTSHCLPDAIRYKP